jgi:hypothetical protein
VSTTVGLHIATVRQYDVSSGKATLVVPGLYGDEAVEAWPFLTSPTAAANLPTLYPGDTVIAFYDGGNPVVILRWFLTGGKVSGGGGDGTDEVWVGPGTPPGAQEVWYDTDAVATPSFYLTGVVKSTAPVGADFGGTIPLNAVWVKSP